jgi:hypothetical protein
LGAGGRAISTWTRPTPLQQDVHHREIYRGKFIRNRFKNVKNPDTGRKLSPAAPADDLIVVEAPHLRIIDDRLWQAAHAVRKQRAAQMNPAGTMQKPILARKPHLLAGLIKCASCSGQMTVITSGWIACSNARHRKTCDHTKTYMLEVLTKEVVGNVAKELTDPEFLKRRVRAKALELAKAEREEISEGQEAQRQLDRLNLQIARLVDVLGDGDLPVDEIKYAG